MESQRSSSGNSGHIEHHGAGGWGEMDLGRTAEQPSRSVGSAGHFSRRRTHRGNIAETSRAVLGADTDAASTWLDKGRIILIRDGWPGISAFLDETHKPLRSKAKRKSLTSLKSYLASHMHPLNYADRLAAGKSIGSGQVEGACKNMIGRRLKQTGARWAVPRVNRMVGLCANLYSKQWNLYWNSILKS